MSSTDAAADAGAYPAPRWWGHSREHGWVVLDRTIPGNEPGVSALLRFLRCKDGKVVPVARKEWKQPNYEFAPNYLKRLPKAEGETAGEVLRSLQARWEEFEAQLHAQCPPPAEPPVRKAPRAAKVAVEDEDE